MKLTDLISKSEKPFFSVEITPPLKTQSINQVFGIIDRLLPYHPAFINVTYHQEALGTKEIDGWSKQVYYQRRASIVGICAAIRYKYNIEVVPHFLCGGFDQFETEDALFDLHFLGIENVLALRGDPREGEKHFIAKLFGHQHASDLVRQIARMRHDSFVHELAPESGVSLCVGVAGYPEKHHEADSPEEDLLFLRKKVEAGADFIVTQMFFDFETFVAWETRCREAGIKIPIIPGLKPLTKRRQLKKIPPRFHLTIPSELEKTINECSSDAEVYRAGVEWTVELSHKLLAHGVPGIHYFSMDNGQDVADVASKVF